MKGVVPFQASRKTNGVETTRGGAVLERHGRFEDLRQVMPLEVIENVQEAIWLSISSSMRAPLAPAC